MAQSQHPKIIANLVVFFSFSQNNAKSLFSLIFSVKIIEVNFLPMTYKYFVGGDNHFCFTYFLMWGGRLKKPLKYAGGVYPSRCAQSPSVRYGSKSGSQNQSHSQ